MTSDGERRSSHAIAACAGVMPIFAATRASTESGAASIRVPSGKYAMNAAALAVLEHRLVLALHDVIAELDAPRP